MCFEDFMREQRERKINYNYSKYGTTGVFSSESAQPIEYILTSIPIDNVEDLSFAREINDNARNFDYLIQRDIDEDRARKDICSYLTSASCNKTFFLPPLIVAVVGVDKDNGLQDYFPNMEVRRKDKTFIREWVGLFKVTNYLDDEKGVNLRMTPEGVINIDLEQVLFEMYLPSSSSGGRLVVIDGQHRLFALKYLYTHERDKVKGITIPICIVYSPRSTKENHLNSNELVDVPTILRKLFVDVNSTVEKVSGHFLTLLSDDNFGSIICREFCSTLYNETGSSGLELSLVEWNTKNHKESKTISRIHSITSIGLLNETLYDYFGKSRSKLNILEALIEFDIANYNSADMDGSVSIDELPWSGFNVEIKEDLKNKAKVEIVPYLKRIFFEADVFNASFLIFQDLVGRKLTEIKEERDVFSECYNYLRNYYMYNDPIPETKGIKSKCKTVQTRLNQWYQEEIKEKSNSIAYTVVYQKSLLFAWIEICLICKKIGLDKEIATSLLIEMMNKTLSKEFNFYDYTHPYMQDNLYSGSKIRVAKRTSEQFKLLTFAILGNDGFINSISLKYNLQSEQKQKLHILGKDSSSIFFQKLRSEKQKLFSKNYKHNFSLSAEDKRKLTDAEEKRNAQIFSSSDSENKLHAAIAFDELIRSMVETDLLNCAKILGLKLGYEDFFYLVDDDEQE